MTRITWIIIILIVLSICVTCLEVLLRFAILNAQKGKGQEVGEVGVTVARKLARIGPPSYAGPSLLAARGVVWAGSGVKGLFV